MSATTLRALSVSTTRPTCLTTYLPATTSLTCSPLILPTQKEGTAEITSGKKDLYEEGDIITVKATPASGYKFVGWNDGATENPYNYKFGGGNFTLLAQFEKAEAAGAGAGQGTSSSGDGGH